MVQHPSSTPVPIRYAINRFVNYCRYGRISRARKTYFRIQSELDSSSAMSVPDVDLIWSEAILAAAANNCVEIIEWIHRVLGNVDPALIERCLVTAAQNTSLDVAMWLSLFATSKRKLSLCGQTRKMLIASTSISSSTATASWSRCANG